MWDYGTPVPIKYITDPTMHAITNTALHPDGTCFVAQSSDSTIATYFAGERVALNRKKTFRGHVAGGFACALAFSPDGRYLVSGDGDGALWYWEWRSGKVVKHVSRAHADGPSVGVAWHPLQPSWVVSSGWDSAVNLWS